MLTLLLHYSVRGQIRKHGLSKLPWSVAVNDSTVVDTHRFFGYNDRGMGNLSVPSLLRIHKVRRIIITNSDAKASSKQQNTFLLRIPNTKAGQRFYAQFRKYLNKQSYGVDRKATGPRPNGEFNSKMDTATSVRVYLQAKTPKGLKQLDLNS
jgi:hypothetical protein